MISNGQKASCLFSFHDNQDVTPYSDVTLHPDVHPPAIVYLHIMRIIAAIFLHLFLHDSSETELT